MNENEFKSRLQNEALPPVAIPLKPFKERLCRFRKAATP